jgi:hypothetical protein
VVQLTESEPIVESPQTPATQYKSLLRSFAVRLCVAVTLGVILLGSVEFYSYLRYRPGTRDELEPAIKLRLSQGASAAEREYWKEFEQANKVTYHQYVLWRRVPYEGKLLSIDQDGVRRTLHTRCGDRTFTVWMFGDSAMWGAGTPDGETIPSFVARDYEKAGKPVCIMNYAEKGWSNTQEMVGLIEQLKHAARKPDIVLFYDGGSDAFGAYQSGRADVHQNYVSFKNFLDKWVAAQKSGFTYLKQTNTYNLLTRVADKVPLHNENDPVPAAARDVETLSSAVVDNYLQNMDIVETLAKQYGFRAIFAWYPNMAVGHKQLTPYEQRVLELEYQNFPDLGSMYEATYKRGLDIKRPDFYYLGDLLDEQKASLYVGISHLNPEGNEIVAARLFDILEHKSSASAGSGVLGSTQASVSGRSPHPRGN